MPKKKKTSSKKISKGKQAIKKASKRQPEKNPPPGKKTSKKKADKKIKKEASSGKKSSLKTTKIKPPKKSLSPKKKAKGVKKIKKKKTEIKPNTGAKPKSPAFSLSYCEKELKKLWAKEKEEKLILKDMRGRAYCAVENCDYPALAENHCRIHFFGLYKTIKKKKQILEQDLLAKTCQHLAHKHSFAVFDYLFKDLSSDKDFKSALKKITNEDI